MSFVALVEREGISLDAQRCHLGSWLFSWAAFSASATCFFPTITRCHVANFLPNMTPSMLAVNLASCFSSANLVGFSRISFLAQVSSYNRQAKGWLDSSSLNIEVAQYLQALNLLITTGPVLAKMHNTPLSSPHRAMGEGSWCSQGACLNTRMRTLIWLDQDQCMGSTWCMWIMLCR